MFGTIGHLIKHASFKHPLDDAEGRRKNVGVNEYLKKQRQLDVSNIKITQELVEKPNKDGSVTSMFTKLFEPQDPTKAKGMLLHCVGFVDRVDWTPTDIGAAFAKQGFVVFMFDNKGMGRSDGLFSYINDW
eukprot:307092_1